jgi:hypothetical protein
VTCKVLVVGLILFAVFLPLAALPLATFVPGAPLTVGDIAPSIAAEQPAVPLLAVTFTRGPPSR